MRLPEQRLLFLGLAGLGLLMLVPLLSVTTPPLTDLPNHISRLHILATIGKDPALQENYIASWGLIPNLAIDVLGLPLARIGAPYTAGKAFAILAFVTALLGMLVLHYTLHRSITAWTGVIFFVAYNQTFIYGLLNFYFGVGLAFLLLAAWIRYTPNHPSLRLWLFPFGALAIYFSHLVALGVFAILLGGYELSALLRHGEHRVSTVLKKSAVVGWQFIAPAALLLVGGKDGTELEGSTRYLEPLTKVLHLLAPFRVYVEPIDLVTIIFLIILFAAAWWKRGVRFAPELRIGLAVLALLAVLSPAVVLSIYGLDQRFAVIAAMLFLAGSRISIPARNAAVALAAVAVALLAWRAIELTVHWRKFDAQFAELREAVKVMRRGASVLPAQGWPDNARPVGPLGSDFTYWHVASFAVVERSLFNPQTFTARHQPVKVTPARTIINCSSCRPLSIEALQVFANPEISWETLELPFERNSPDRHAAQWPDRFDYVLLVDFGDHWNPFPDLLLPLHTGSFFVIYENRGKSRR